MQQKILVVEDDLFLREVYIETLTSEGYFVESAPDGEVGYQKIKDGQWDLVLLDIIMPKTDGLEVVRKLKAENAPKTYKTLIFLTNLDKEADIKEAMQLGDGYLIKSQLTPQDLLNEVKAHLTKSQQAPTS
ncbi:MAG TPA: response regulator [Patescibacteria group bacterium]|nr:response regulator [Patescibacteria group bacterium]